MKLKSAPISFKPLLQNRFVDIMVYKMTMMRMNSIEFSKPRSTLL
jgi:hypothetical protein